ncbi:MAG: hypothetical protein RR364_05375 [Lachnospiraceae bacterium]
MEKQMALFDNYKYCASCRRLLAPTYEFDICPSCMEQELFKEVREYIRKNDVTEFDVAEHFQLPIRRVRTWIREGKIEYQNNSSKQVMGAHCARCGELVKSGELCQKCIALLKRPKATIGFSQDIIDAGKMHFLDQEKEKK